MPKALQLFITWAPTATGIIALYIAYVQLSSANMSLNAANTISISQESRQIADEIFDAADDLVRLNNAYDRYGDFIAHAGYLASQNQLPVSYWEYLKADFCRLYEEINFQVWYARNINADHIKLLYPDFDRMKDHPKCKQRNL
jgi:hypothetical protein